jgi:hypothetical protein
VVDRPYVDAPEPQGSETAAVGPACLERAFFHSEKSRFGLTDIRSNGPTNI